MNERNVCEVVTPPTPRWFVARAIAWVVATTWVVATAESFWLRFLAGLLCASCVFEVELWKRRAECAVKDRTALLKLMSKEIVATIGGTITKHFKGTPVANHVIRLSEESLTIKVGDDDCMVSVDVDRFLEDTEAALEQARREWSAARKARTRE